MDRIEELLSQSRDHVFRHELTLSEPRTESKGHNKLRRRYLAVGGAIAVSTLLLAGFADPQLIHIGNTFNLLKSPMFSIPDVTQPVDLGYGEKVNQSVSVHGITLTIGNVYADSTKLEFDMVESFTSNGLYQPVVKDTDMHLDINGTRNLNGFSGGEFQAVSGDKYAGVVYFPVANDQPYEPLPTQFTLNVHVDQIGNIQGPWNFSIPVSWQRLATHTRTFNTHAQVSDESSTISVTQVSIGPAQTVIQGIMTMPEDTRMPDEMLVMDDRGHVIGGPFVVKAKQMLTDGLKQITFAVTGGAPSAGSTQLSITPELFAGARPPLPLNGQYPQTLQVKPGLHVTVTAAEFRGDETLVRLQTDRALYAKETTYDGVSTIGQYFLQSQDGKASYAVGSKSVDFDKNHPDEAVVVFGSVDPNKDWSLTLSRIDVEAGLRLTVPLK